MNLNPDIPDLPSKIRSKTPLPAPVRGTIPLEPSKNVRLVLRAYGLILMAVSDF